MKPVGWCLAVAFLGAAGMAKAGPVSIQGGQIVISFEGPDGTERASRSVGLTLPGAATVAYNGADSAGDPVLGDGSVEYNVAGTGNGASIHAVVFASHDDPAATLGARTVLTLSFTTDRATRFHLSADPQVSSGSKFDLQLGTLTAAAEVTTAGSPVLPSEFPITFGDSRGVFDIGTLVRDGVLAPGAHSLVLTSRAGISRADDEAPDGGPPIASSALGTFDLVLTAEDAPAAVPLPPALWSGLTALAGLFGCGFIRRRQGSATDHWRVAYGV